MSAHRNTLAALILVLACEDSAAEPEQPAHAEGEPHVDEPAHEALPTRVRLSPKVIASAAIRTAPVTREVLPVTVALPGEIAADPDRTARISSPVAGRLEQVSFKEGSVVKKGDVLALLRVPDLGQLRSLHASALAKAGAARANAARLKALSAQRLASEQAYVDAVAAAEALDLEARAAEQQLAALGLGAGTGSPHSSPCERPSRAPWSRATPSIGQPVTRGASHRRDRRLVRSLVPGARVREGSGPTQARRDRRGAAQRLPRAALRRQRRVHRPAGRSDRAHGHGAHPSGEPQATPLRVGLFGTALVSTLDASTTRAPRAGGPAQRAHGDRGQARGVRAPRGRRLRAARRWSLGESAAGKVEVLSGLRDGEQVVVEGVFTLKSVVLKSTFAEDE